LILVVTGSSGYPLERLLRACDAIAPAIGERFLLQTGRFPFAAKHCDTIGITTYDHLIGLYRECELIIAHTSSGPLIYARKFGKPIISTPRRPELGEAFDDHQVECAEALAALPDPMRITLRELDGLENEVRSLLRAVRSGLAYAQGGGELASLHKRLREVCS
jgi:UDP-N-acetylglucosamine transferase subunit ALG13